MARRGSHSGRSGADAALIAALAAGATREAAAAAAGVSTRTVFRRLDDDDFVLRVAAARADFIGAATARLAAASTTAVDTLTSLMDVAHSPGVRLGAARSILDQAQRWRLSDEVEARLAVVEIMLRTEQTRR